MKEKKKSQTSKVFKGLHKLAWHLLKTPQLFCFQRFQRDWGLSDGPRLLDGGSITNKEEFKSILL
jgi:hypothetical protein